MKKKANRIFLTGIAVILFFAGSCKPSIGTAWYPRSVSDEEQKVYITEIKVNGTQAIPFLTEQPKDDADKLKKITEAQTYLVNVSPAIEEITAENIEVKAVLSLSKMEEVKVKVEINGDGVPLSSGKPVPVTLKISDNEGKYGSVTKVIKITQSEPHDLILKTLTICGVDAISGTVTVPYKESVILPAKIKAEFTYGTETVLIPVEIENSPIELKEAEPVDIRIFVRGKKGLYKDFEFYVNITRAERQENEDAALQPEEIYILGIKNDIGKAASVPINTEKITADDIVAVFKDFADIPVELSPDPALFNGQDILSVKLSVKGKPGQYQDWEMPLTIKKDAMSVYNPQDKNGNKKYILKINTIVEEVDPFDYYTENYEFPVSKFDNWVLNMPSMSGIVPSYKFLEGSWSGSPEVWSNEPATIGSGIRAVSNVKVYRYKTRSERWAGGEVPPSNPHDNRFYFYRFTAEASGGIKPDSSLFCVDRYSKFLFYYSDPSYIKEMFGNKVPLNWVDYAVPSKGDHVQFTEPFYMTDPVGYVKEDGSVVIYSWVKDKINNSNYAAPQNGSFTKPAEKKATGAGYSPYKNKITKKRVEVVTTDNPDYTVTQPIILAQPKPIRIKLSTEEDVSFGVKTAPVPDGENLSYQWYTNTVQSNEGGTEITGENRASYTPDKNQETNCYVYCEVKNTNTKNGKSETVKSNAVKLLVTNGLLTTDAEQPHIIKQPEGKVFPINTSGAVTLKVEALSTDKGVLSYQWYKNTDSGTESGSEISGAKEASYSATINTSAVKTEYYYCIVTNTNNNVDGNTTAVITTTPAKVEVEESYNVIFNKEGSGTISALYDGKLLNPNPRPNSFDNYVKKGGTVTFFAQATDGYEVSEWTGVPQSAISENKMSARLTVEKQETVKVVFRKIPDTRKLTITAKKIRNVDMWWNKNYPYTYFVYNLKARHGNNANSESYTTLWHANEGKKLREHWAGELYKARKLYVEESMFSGEYIEKKFDSRPDNYQVQFDIRLIKYHNVSNVGSDVYKEKILVDYGNSLITISYQKDNDMWVWSKIAEKDLGNSVIVEFPDTVSLKRGEEKDFTFKYTSSDSANYAKGTVEVTYTLKWE